MRVKITFIIRADSVQGKSAEDGGAGFAEGKLFEVPFYSFVKIIPVHRLKSYLLKIKSKMAAFSKVLDIVNGNFGGGEG